MKKRVTNLGLILLSCLAPSCGASRNPESKPSIYQGAIDTGHDAVGLLMIDGKPWCTATLVAPQVALSAGHCFNGKSQKPANLYLQFNSGSIRTQVTDVVVHPSYSRAIGRGVINDFAVLKLADAPGLTPITLASSVPFVGEPVLFVGYGYKDSLDKASFDGTKRQGPNKVAQVESKKLYFPKPADDSTSQVCYGDSGGPVFVIRPQGMEQIGVITGSLESAASRTCRIQSYASRIDNARIWLDAQIAKAGENLAPAEPTVSAPNVAPLADEPTKDL